MPTVTNLAVSVTARTSEFNSKMQESAGIVRSFGRTVVGVARGLLTFNNALRAIKLVGVTLATRWALKFADAIIQTAKKTGLATEELIGLQFAAGLAGIKITKLTAHLEKMVPKLGSVQEVLKGMGVTGGALAMMVEVTERLGVSMNQIQSKGVQDAIAAVRRLWTVIKATSLILAVGLAPAIKWVAKELLHFAVLARVAVVELATRLEPHIRTASEWLVQFATAGANAGMVIPKSFGLIAEAGAKLANAIVFVEAAWHGLNAVVLTVSSNMVAGVDKILGVMRTLLMEFAAGARALAKSNLIPISKEDLDAMNEAIDFFQRGVTRSQKAVAGMADMLAVDATLAIEKMNKAWADFASGKAGEDFKATFADIAARAAAIVADILKLQQIGLKIPDIAKKVKLKRERIVEFQEISLARVALQGINTPGRPQIVRDPQLEKTNELLRQIRILMTGVGLTS